MYRLLEVQAGVASRRQIAALGFSDGQLRGMRNAGVLVSLLPGVYRGVGIPVSWLTRLVAAALFLEGRAIAALATAARLHQLPGFEEDPQVEFVRIIESRGIGGRVTVHSARRLDETDRCVVTIGDFDGVKIPRALSNLGVVRSVAATTSTRTVIDLAARLNAANLARLVDSAISLRKTTAGQLVERLEDVRDCGVSGVRRMDQVLIDAGVESWLERRFLELLRGAGLPRPQCQVVFKEGSRTVARVDFHFAGTNVIVEVSGRRGHVTDAERRKDARRRNELQRAGMLVIEFVTSDVLNEPGYVLATLRRALRLG